jgi:hypothetical protein
MMNMKCRMRLVMMMLKMLSIALHDSSLRVECYFYSSYLILHDMTILIPDKNHLQGSEFTKDIQDDRVRVWTNEHGVVTQEPVIG